MKVTWKAVDEVELHGSDSGMVLITFRPVANSHHAPFGIAVPEKDMRGFADFFAEVARRLEKEGT